MTSDRLQDITCALLPAARGGRARLPEEEKRAAACSNSGIIWAALPAGTSRSRARDGSLRALSHRGKAGRGRERPRVPRPLPARPLRGAAGRAGQRGERRAPARPQPPPLAAGMGPRGARRAAGCLLLCWALAAARAAPRRTPSFDGHVAENRPAGTRVRGLSIPLTRLGPEPWCAKVQGRRWHLQLLGEGHSHFQVSLDARTARVWLRTRRPLDREARDLYSLRLGLCCKRCAPQGAAPAELAALTVRVLDDNDNAPRFVGPGSAQLRVEETLALKSQVWQARAEDADAGANAELRYFALPRSAHFFVVPRSGRVVLVSSLLHLRAPIPLRVYARDRGRPALLSEPLELEVLPQPKRLPPPPPRRRRAALPPAAPLALALPEDARPGTRLATLAPARFASAWFELLSPPVEESPVSVERESGEVTLRAALDREAVAAWELVVRVQERRGGC